MLIVGARPLGKCHKGRGGKIAEKPGIRPTSRPACASLPASHRGSRAHVTYASQIEAILGGDKGLKRPLLSKGRSFWAPGSMPSPAARGPHCAMGLI